MRIPATDRAIPPCPHFGACGGCQLQDLTYAAQLALKAAQLQALLEPTNLTLPQLQLHPSPPLAYRNRIRLTLAEVDGQLRAGYLRATQDTPETTTLSILPITQCPIAAPILWRTAEAFLALINESPTPWLRNSQQILDQLELFTNANESALQLTLYLRTQSKTAPTKLTTAFTALCETLRTQILELAGAGIALLPLASPDRSRRTETARPGPTWGAPGLNYTVADTTYWVPRTAFFQINRYLIPELLTLITANEKGQLAWDLYAGVGLFTRALTRTFSQVIAVEAAEPAATDLANSLKSINKAEKKTHHAVAATTLDFLQSAVIQRARPDLILMDPPRAGVGPEVCALLARLRTPTLVYVSCDPTTLSRDLALLTQSGYHLTQLHLADMFPQTFHLETVAILQYKD